MLAHPPPSPLAKGCFLVTPGFHDHHFDFPPEPDRHDWSDKTNNGHLKIKTTLLVCLTFYVNELHRFLFGVKRWNGIFQYFYILKGSWGQKSKNLFSTGRDDVRLQWWWFKRRILCFESSTPIQVVFLRKSKASVLGRDHHVRTDPELRQTLCRRRRFGSVVWSPKSYKSQKERPGEW